MDGRDGWDERMTKIKREEISRRARARARARASGLLGRLLMESEEDGSSGEQKVPSSHHHRRRPHGTAK
jgi:hypothetical protein